MRVVVASGLIGGASLACTTVTFAQVGLGAERYEVTISPPKRPGSETAPAVPSGAAADGAPAAPANADPAAPAATGSGETGEPATGSSPPFVAAPAPPNVAPRTLQVGAFRQSASAKTLRDKLAASFAEVTVIEVQSGGEPLYRVYVGRLARGPALEDLKRRLVAAGYPTFEVPAPAPSAPN